jgi:hypothetical protein
MMDARFLPNHLLRLVTAEDRAELGLETYEERMKKLVVKTERQLQSQIVQYLRLRGIEVLWHRTDKRSHATKGWPDITFAVLSNGFPMACGYEVKFGSGTLAPGQNQMLQRLQTRPNSWRVRVIRNFIEVVDDLREMGL